MNFIKYIVSRVRGSFPESLGIIPQIFLEALNVGYHGNLKDGLTTHFLVFQRQCFNYGGSKPIKSSGLLFLKL